MLSITYALKRHYSSADAEALRWILAPTAWLVEIACRAPFVFEPNAGYVNTTLRFAIAPSCAGVNFMIVAYCSATLGFVTRMRTLPSKLVLLLVGAGLAYVSTVLVNTARIVIALALQTHPVSIEGVSPEQIHSAEGILVYAVSLFSLYLLADQVLQPAQPRPTS